MWESNSHLREILLGKSVKKEREREKQVICPLFSSFPVFYVEGHETIHTGALFETTKKVIDDQGVTKTISAILRASHGQSAHTPLHEIWTYVDFPRSLFFFSLVYLDRLPLYGSSDAICLVFKKKVQEFRTRRYVRKICCAFSLSTLAARL